MESTEHSDGGLGEAEIALTQAQAARDRMTAGLVLPSFFYSSIGAAIAVQIGASAAVLGIDQTAVWSWVALIAALVAFAVVAVVQLARFRRLNGVWLGALASRVVLGTANLTSATYIAAFAGATWAAMAAQWWLVPLAAIAGAGDGVGRGGLRAQSQRHAPGPQNNLDLTHLERPHRTAHPRGGATRTDRRDRLTAR